MFFQSQYLAILHPQSVPYFADETDQLIDHLEYKNLHTKFVYFCFLYQLRRVQVLPVLYFVN